MVLPHWINLAESQWKNKQNKNSRQDNSFVVYIIVIVPAIKAKIYHEKKLHTYRSIICLSAPEFSYVVSIFEAVHGPGWLLELQPWPATLSAFQTVGRTGGPSGSSRLGQFPLSSLPTVPQQTSGHTHWPELPLVTLSCKRGQEFYLVVCSRLLPEGKRVLYSKGEGRGKQWKRPVLPPTLTF